MDESNKQLLSEVHAPPPMAPGQIHKADHEYVRKGLADTGGQVHRVPPYKPVLMLSLFTGPQTHYRRDECRLW
jgi:hypothetical protein